MKRSAGLLVAIALSLSCAGDSHLRAGERQRAFDVRQPFPTQERLEQLMAAAPSDPLGGLGEVPASVDRWTLTAELPSAAGHAAYAGSDPVGRRMADRIAAAGHVPTEGMMCLAHEYAHFLATHGDAPPVDIQQFMVGRCGAAIARPAFSVVRFSSVQDAEQLLASEAETRRLLERVSSKGEVGIAWAQTGDKLVVVAAWGKPELRIEPVPFLVPTGGAVVIRGEVAWPFEWLSATFTRGELDVGHCAPLPGVGRREGEFAVQCAVDGRDALSFIEIYAAQRGALLGLPVFTIAVSPSGSAALEYVAPAYSLPVDEADRRPEAIVAALNALRSKLKRQPLQFDEDQSQVVHNLFAHLGGARDLSAQNEVALGIMAGWHVDGTIRDGQFKVHVGNVDSSLSRSIAGSLSSPMFRATVLDHAADIVAIGTLEGESSRARGVLYATYDLFEPSSFEEEEAMFFGELDSQRAAMGLEPVLRVKGPKDAAVLRASAERIRKGQSLPGDELDILLEDFVAATGRTFRGLAFAPMRIEGWRPEFPKELFADHVAAAVTISYFKPAGAAWGQHVVLMVYTELDGPLKD